MVSSLTLGQVVVEPGNIEQFYFGKAMMYVCGNGELLFLVLVAKSPHIPHHLKRVRIHGEGVKKVELHLANDPPKLRQISAEDSIARHSAQLREQVIR
jgi:hypothetical protein